MRHFIFLATAAALTWGAAPLHAAPTVDNDAGEWFDDYADNLGVDLASDDPDTRTSNITFDPFGRLLTISDPLQDAELPNQFSTTPIAPASFDAWGSAYINFSAAATDDITLRFVGLSGTVYDLGSIGPSDDSAWDGQVSLASVPASEAQGQLVVQLTARDVGGVTIRPTVQGLRATWSPRSIVRVTQELLDTSVCSREDLVYRLRVSISLVEAKNLVVWAPLGTPSANTQGQDNTLQFVTATDGGRFLPFSSAPLTIGNVTIPPGSAYWQLGTRSPGNTFIVSYSARSPQGTLNGTTYTSTALGEADNADLIETSATVASISSTARPFVRKSTSGTFRIFQQDHAITGDAISYNVTFGNHDYGISTTRCGQTHFDTYIVDDLSAYFAGSEDYLKTPPGVHSISDGGQFHPGPDPLCVAGTGASCVGGFVVPANHVYWDLGDIPVGQRRTVSYSLTLADGTDDDPAGPLVNDQQIVTSARFESRFEGLPRTGGHTLVIGIDNTPGGSYGTGDSIRGRSSISGGTNDNPRLSVNYGEPVTFLYAISNQGASRLDENVIISKVPDGTTFTSAFISAASGANIYYNTGGAANNGQDPPDYDADTGTLGSSWTQSVPSPASATVWVAFDIPEIASPFFPEDGVPTGVVGNISVVVDQPTDACPQTTIVARGLYYLYDVIPVGGGEPPMFNGGLQFTDTEPVQVIPLVPNLSQVSVSDSPDTLLGPGTLSYFINIPNRQPQGAETDTALDVSVRLTLPTASVNGVTTPLAFQGIQANGGTADLSELPSAITVTYPSIAPGASQQIQVTFAVPQGLVDGSSVRLTAQATGRDDICGTTSGGDTEVTAIRVEPALSASKSVNLSVVNLGDPVQFTIDYSNTGDGVATQAWIVDRVADGFVFESAVAPAAGGAIWFSSAQPPSLPPSLRDDFSFDQSVITTSGLFSPGTLESDGTYSSPFGADTTYIAFQLDDPTLSPPQVPTDQVDSLMFTVSVDDADTGDTLANEALVFSSELIGAISNQVQVTVSANPSIRVSRACPGVATSTEIVTFTVDYFNDASNLDESVILEEIIPDEVTFLDATHSWNEATDGAYDAIDVPAEQDGSTVRFRVTDAIDGPLRSLEGGRFTIRVQVNADVATGTLTTLAGLAFASNGAINTPVTAFSSCELLVANADVTIDLRVDREAPVPGDVLTYTAVLSNPGAHFAETVSFTSVLPQGVTYIPGSTRVTTPGWMLTPNTEPTQVVGSLIWSVSTDNAITGMSGAGIAGYLPGEQGAISVTFQVTVNAGVPPATTLENCATITTTTVEDMAFPNESCVSVRTPLPDPYVEKRAPALAQPGDRLSYRILYGNASRQPSGQVFVVDTLFDGPTPDGSVDVSYLTHTAGRGEAVYFASSAPSGPIPAFDPADPEATGWTQDPSSLSAVTHVGFLSGPLAGSAGPYSVYVDIELRSPVDGALPQPGATILNTATVQMVGPNQSDDDNDENNVSVASTRTPAVDISLTKTCDPEGGFPGTRPGETMTFTLQLANNGTVPAHGLAIVDPLSAGFVLSDTSVGDVTVTDSNGSPSALVGLDGEAIDYNVLWTAQDGVYTVGSRAAEGEPDYYRRVGLAPGDRVMLTINAQVAGDVPSETTLTNAAQATTDYAIGFQPGDPEEEVLDNNTDQCSVVVYRPDPLVVKSVADASGGQGPVGVGGRVTYTVKYDNIGGAVADRALLEDYLPQGTRYVVGSFAGLPDGATLKFDDGSGTFSYSPVGATGEVDDAVVAVRIDWGDTPLRAPTNAIFEQLTAIQFEEGTFVGTKVDTERDAVTIGGGVSDMPAYISPVFPGDGEGMVIEWGRIVLSTFIPAESMGSVSVTVLDADSGTPVPSYIGLTPDETGIIDLSAINAADYPRLQLRADFVGGGIQCAGGGEGLTFLESATPYPRSGRVQLSNDSQVAGRLGNGKGIDAAVWGGDSGAEFIQVLDALGPMTGRVGMQFANDGSYAVTIEHGADWAHEAVIFTPQEDGMWRPTSFAPDNVLDLTHDSVLFKHINNGIAVGEIRSREYDFDDGDDGDPRPFVAVKETDGTWSEAAFPVPDPSQFDEVSLRFVNDDGVIFGECNGTENGTVCIYEPDGDTWVLVYDSGSDLKDGVPVTNVDLADMTRGGGVIGRSSIFAVYFSKDRGTWDAVFPSVDGGETRLRLDDEVSVLGSGHYVTTANSSYYALVPASQGDGLEVVSISDTAEVGVEIVRASDDGTLFGTRDRRATIWRRDGDGSYEAVDLGEDFAFSEIITTNRSGLARGYVGLPFEEGECSDTSNRFEYEVPESLCNDPDGCDPLDVSCSQNISPCSCTTDSNCRPRSRRDLLGRCVDGTCQARRGAAWVPDAAVATGFRRVMLENGGPTKNEDGDEREGWHIEDTDYPGTVTEDGRIMGIMDRSSQPHVCEGRHDEWTQPLPVYWEPGSETGTAPMRNLPTPMVHSASVIGANSDSVLVGRSYTVNAIGQPTIWRPSAGAPGGWSPTLLPEPTFDEIAASPAWQSYVATQLAEGNQGYPWYLRDTIALSIADDGRITGVLDLRFVWDFGSTTARSRGIFFGIVWLPAADGYTIQILPAGDGGYPNDYPLEALPQGLIFGADEYRDGFEYPDADGHYGDPHYWVPREDGTYVTLTDAPVAPLAAYVTPPRHNANGFVYGTAKDDQGSVGYVLVPDPSVMEGARVVRLPDGDANVVQVSDMNNQDVLVGTVGSGETMVAVAWVPSGVDQWTMVTLGPGSAKFIDDSGRIVGDLLTGGVVIYEPQGNDVWTGVALATPDGVSIKNRRETFKAGFVLGNDHATAWEKVGGTWRVVPLPAPPGDATSVRLMTALSAPALGGTVYVGVTNTVADYRAMVSARLIVWNPDGSGGYTAFDVTPEGKRNAYIVDYLKYPQAKDGLIAIYTNDFNYEYEDPADADDSIYDLDESNTRQNSERFALLADAASPTGWTPVSLGVPVGKARNELKPQPAVPGLWTLESWGRDTTPAVFGCTASPGAFLDDWRVIYRTDQAPSLSFRVEVADFCQTSVVNTATISTTTPEVTTANNSSSATFSVATADVRVTLAVDKGVAAFDDELVYTLTVINDGPNAARDVVATTSPAAGTDGTAQTFTIGAMAAGARQVFTYTADVTEVNNGVALVANADVTSSSIDCNTANNTSSATTITGNLPNVYVSVTAPAVVRVNEPFTYTIMYGNDGNAPASNIVLTDVLPVGVTLVPGDQPTTFNYESLDAGATGVETLTVVVTDCARIGSALVDRATISADADTNGNDNSAQVSTTVAAPAATLVLDVTEDRATVETGEVGDLITFTVHFVNTGASDVVNAVIMTPIPADATLAAGTITGGGAVEGDAIVWRIPRVRAGGSGAVAFSASPTGADPVSVSAASSGDGICPSQAATSAVATVVEPGVHVVKTADRPITCGTSTPIGWSILVTNTSDQPIAGIVVTDTLPSGVTYVADSVTGRGASDTGAPVLVWNLGTLPAGTGLTLTYDTTSPANAGRLLTNDASVEVGGVVTRTSSRAAVRVQCGPTLVATKALGVGCSQPGDAFDITVRVTNQSQSAAQNVVITDYVPETLVFGGTDGDATYSLTTRQVELVVETLAPGATRVLTYQASVADAAPSGAIVIAQAAATTDGRSPVVSNVVSAVVLRCDDMNVCTADLCDAATGCLNPAVEDMTACDDGDLCTQTDSCVAGVCAGAEPVECTALDVCHRPGTCDPQTGVCDNPNADDGSGCDDGDVCTTVDACVSGSCVGDVPPDCDDGDVCTRDLCDSETGCYTEAADDGIVCDDDNLCSDTSQCLAGVCVAVDAADCDDGNLCTLDRCDPALGCVPQPVPNGSFCSDADLCTTDDRCVDGVCAGSPRGCPDPEACRFPGECNPATGVCDYAVRPGDIPVPIRLTDLGTLGGESSIAYDVNDASVVVGSAQTEAGADHAFRWQDGTMTDLTPEADDAVAVRINETGVVAGVREDGDDRHVFVAQAGATATSLWAVTGPLLDATLVYGPNAAGAVAGNGVNDEAAAAAFFSADGTTFAEVTPQAGGTDVTVTALGDGGHVVGRVTAPNGNVRGFTWSAGTFADVGTLGGSTSSLVAVNATGAAVGASDVTGDEARHAVIWQQATGLVDLGTLCESDGTTCGTQSRALAINDSGAVLGISENADGDERAFIWDVATGMIELDTLGGGVTTPVALNAMGASVGIFTTGQGDRYSVAWAPIADDGAGQAIATAGALSSSPVAMNAAGQVAGTMVLAGDTTRAYFWDASRGDSENLGTLGGSTSQAFALSGAGRVVGVAAVSTGVGHAFISDAPQTACIVCEVDNTPPTIICPVVSGVAECVGGGAAVALGDPSVYDACGQPVEVSSTASERYPVGTSVVTFTATDSAGNDATCGTVVEVVDTVAPTILCPDAVTVEADDNVCGARVALTANAIDACDGADVTVLGADRVFPLGTTEVRLTAVDGAGNASTCTTTVTVTDPNPLTLTCTESVTFEAPPNLCGYEEVLTAEVVDVCSSKLSVEASQSRFNIGETVVDFEASRGAEVVTCQTVVTVNDVTDPTVRCGAPESTVVLPAVFTSVATDACTATITVGEPVCVVIDDTGAETEVSDGCATTVDGATVDIRTIPGTAAEVRWLVTATDPSGNETETTCATTVTLLDIPVGPDLTGLTARGGGGCSGGSDAPAHGMLWLLGLLGLALARRWRGARHGA